MSITPVMAQSIGLSEIRITDEIQQDIPIYDDDYWTDIDCILSPTEVLEMTDIEAKIKGSLSPDDFIEFKIYQPKCQRANLIYMNKVWERINGEAKNL
ncbi:MAG: hypothetical protein WBA93_16800 [Microcoleaceae cyanobacterium]